MRELLFRGKRTDNGAWACGHLFRAWERGYQRAYLCWGNFNNQPVVEEVIPETVGQYTGLTDKNGKKIFEGDIVQIEDFTHGCALNYKQPTSKWVVKWYEETARFGIDYMKTLTYDFTKSEIIGNIHDNHELLEGGE